MMACRVARVSGLICCGGIGVEAGLDCDWRWLGLLAGLPMTLCLSSQLVIAEDAESPKDDISAQIRSQGYACDQCDRHTRALHFSFAPAGAMLILRYAATSPTIIISVA